MKRFLLAATALTAVSASAFAADLPRRYAPPAPAAYVAVPTFTWTGFYVGANAGGAVDSNISVQQTGPFGGAASQSINAGGFLVGGTLGYNYQIHPNIVVGVEGDIGYADIQSRASASNAFGAVSQSVGIDGYLGTVRGRIGYATGQWLFYGTGGYAFADGRLTSTQTGGGVTQSVSASRDLQGYVVGGGIEYAINNNLSVKGEYLYADFERRRNTSPAGVLTTSNQDVHLLKLGVNYKFSAF